MHHNALYMSRSNIMQSYTPNLTVKLTISRPDVKTIDYPNTHRLGNPSTMRNLLQKVEIAVLFAFVVGGFLWSIYSLISG